MHKIILTLSKFTIVFALIGLVYPYLPAFIQNTIGGQKGGHTAVLLMAIVGIISAVALMLCLKWYQNESGPYEGSAIATITLGSFIGFTSSISGLLKIFGIWETPYMVVYGELMPIMQFVLVITFIWYLVIAMTCKPQPGTNIP